jgi:hypothetical protein
MGAQKQRQTMDKMRREQAVKERRARKQEKKDAARLAKAMETRIDDVLADASS